MVRVPSHLASSEAVASGECPCAFSEVSELIPAQPPIRRKKAHPIRKILTTTADSWARTPCVRTAVGRSDHKDSVEDCEDRHIPQKNDLCGYQQWQAGAKG